MALTVESIRQTLQDHNELNARHVHVEDISNNCGTSFAIEVVSTAFESQSLLCRHRLVHKALEKQMACIHALKLKCLTPDAFEQSKL